MTEYLKPKFSVAMPTGKHYRDNWDAIFAKKEAAPFCVNDRVRVIRGARVSRVGTVYEVCDGEWPKYKVQLDGDCAGSWFAFDDLEVL